MNKQQLSEDSTIYQYKLVRKIPHSHPFLLLFWVMLAVFASAISLIHSMMDLLYLLFAFTVALAAHVGIVQLILYVRKQSGDWRLSWKFPWIGISPRHTASLSSVQLLYLHVFGLGLSIAVVLFPWLRLDIWLCLCFMHIWLLLPRLCMLWSFQLKTGRGLIKITPADTSYYLP